MKCPKQKKCKNYRNAYGLYGKDFLCIFWDIKIKKCIYKKAEKA
jgi:hypothetical protein